VPLCVNLTLSAAAQKRKEEKSHDLYTSRMRGATSSGQISMTLGMCVRLEDEIKRSKYYLSKFNGLDAVKYSIDRVVN